MEFFGFSVCREDHIMLASPHRWLWVVFAVTVCLASKSAWAKTEHGNQTEDLPGVNAMGVLTAGMGFSGPVTFKWTANRRTAKFTAHGTGQVNNQSGAAHTFTDELTLPMFTGGPFINDIHTTYIVRANGHCTVKLTAAIPPICVDPADNGKDQVGTGPNAVIGSFAAGRDAVPMQKQCLESVGLLASSPILSIDR
jgi:hypothetical protein